MKNIAWVALIPQFCIFLLLAFFFKLAQVSDPGIYAIFAFMGLSIILRLIPSDHRKAVSAYNRGEYQAAIEHFANSYAFFTRHAWLDRTRYISLLSASKLAYKEMALLNSAYCYGQLGDVEMMKKYVKRTLEEYPKSQSAHDAMNTIVEHERESD